MFSTSLITGFTTGAGLIACIGSQNAFVLRQGLLRQHVGAVAFICILSDILLIFAGISGLGVVVKSHPMVLEVVRYAGAAFLAYNAFLAAQRAWRASEILNPAKQGVYSLKTAIVIALTYTWLNPHVYLDTVFLLGSISLNYGDAGKWQFGIGAMTASIVWFLAISYGAKILLPLFRSYRAWQILDGGVALLMGYFCFALLSGQLG